MEKRDLSERLEEEACLNDSEAVNSGTVFFGDEMRLGLIGQVRHRWVPRGVKIRQPVERVFQYLRARVEGVVYGELKAKKEAVERELRKLAACPETVRSLTCWDWIEEALAQSTDSKTTL